MDFLVEMTTHVPDGTAAQEVDDLRAREAAHTKTLAAEGKVQRLWRPPLAPGEWRTFGLFAASDTDDLDRTLATMPLRIWRSDEVTPLGEHVNDPGPGVVPRVAGSQEFLVTFILELPATEDREQLLDQEAHRTRQLGAAGLLRRLWSLPEEGHSLSVWQAAEAEQLAETLRALPLAGWLTTEVVPLTPHPSDPGAW
jgi:muconolactone delta-isomerase